MEKGFLSRLTAAREFSLLAIETNDKIVSKVVGNRGTRTVMNSDSAEISGLEQRFCHLVPRAKYVNCHHLRQALLFVYLISNFQELPDVDALMLAV